MSEIDWDEIARKAREETNSKFREEISTLVRLNDDDIKSIIKQSNIDSERFAEIIKIMKDSSLTNHKKAKAIKDIDNGLRAVIGIVNRFI